MSQLKSTLRKCNPINQYANKRINEIIRKRPLDIVVETTSICPLKCAFCFNGKYARPREIMEESLFEEIVDQYVQMGGGALGLSACQSDMLSDPLLLERIKYLKKKDSLWIHSTVPLISAKRFQDAELCEVLGALRYLEISVQGHDRDSYKEMCGIDAFDVLKTELQRVYSLVTENGFDIKIEVSFRTNCREKLLASGIYKDLSKMFEGRTIKDSFFSWGGLIKETDLPEGAKLEKKWNNRESVDCSMPNTTMCIEPDGTVVGCGCIDYRKDCIIGDVSKESLLDVWHSKEAVTFRTAFSKGNIPGLCYECGLYNPKDFYRAKYLKYDPKDGLYYMV